MEFLNRLWKGVKETIAYGVDVVSAVVNWTADKIIGSSKKAKNAGDAAYSQLSEDVNAVMAGVQDVATPSPARALTEQEFQQVETGIRQMMAGFTELMDQWHTPENYHKTAMAMNKADLNNDGTLAGKEEAQALVKHYLHADTQLATMLNTGVQTLCDLNCSLKDQNVPAQEMEAFKMQMQTMATELTGVVFDTLVEMQYDKWLAQAIESGEDTTKLMQDYKQAASERMMHMIEPQLRQELQALYEVTSREQADKMYGIISEGVEKLIDHVTEKTSRMIAENSEIRQELLKTPEIGQDTEAQLKKMSWVELCEASKGKGQTCGIGA